MHLKAAHEWQECLVDVRPNLFPSVGSFSVPTDLVALDAELHHLVLHLLLSSRPVDHLSLDVDQRLAEAQHSAQFHPCLSLVTAADLRLPPCPGDLHRPSLSLESLQLRRDRIQHRLLSQ